MQLYESISYKEYIFVVCMRKKSYVFLTYVIPQKQTDIPDSWVTENIVWCIKHGTKQDINENSNQNFTFNIIIRLHLK